MQIPPKNPTGFAPDAGLGSPNLERTFGRRLFVDSAQSKALIFATTPHRARARRGKRALQQISQFLALPRRSA